MKFIIIPNRLEDLLYYLQYKCLKCIHVCLFIDNSRIRKRRGILRSSSVAIFPFRYARFHLVQMSHMSYSTWTCCHGRIFLFAPNAFRMSYVCFLFYFICTLTPSFVRCHERDNGVHRLNWHNPFIHAILYARFV